MKGQQQTTGKQNNLFLFQKPVDIYYYP